MRWMKTGVWQFAFSIRLVYSQNGMIYIQKCQRRKQCTKADNKIIWLGVHLKLFLNLWISKVNCRNDFYLKLNLCLFRSSLSCSQTHFLSMPSIPDCRFVLITILKSDENMKNVKKDGLTEIICEQWPVAPPRLVSFPTLPNSQHITSLIVIVQSSISIPLPKCSDRFLLCPFSHSTFDANKLEIGFQFSDRWSERLVYLITV